MYLKPSFLTSSISLSPTTPQFATLVPPSSNSDRRASIFSIAPKLITIATAASPPPEVAFLIGQGEVNRYHTWSESDSESVDYNQNLAFGFNVPLCCPAAYKIVSIGHFLKVLPFHWTTQSVHLEEMKESKENIEAKLLAIAPWKDRLLVNLNLSCIFSYVGLKLYYLIHKQFVPVLQSSSANNDTGNINLSTSGSPTEPEGKVPYSIMGSLYFVMYGLALLLHFNNVLNLDDICCTVNTYCSRIRGHLGKIFGVTRSIALLDNLWLMYICLIHTVLLLSVPLFLNTSSNLSLYTYCLEGRDWRIYWIFVGLDLYCLYAFTVIVGLYIFLIVDCSAVVEKISKNMK